MIAWSSPRVLYTNIKKGCSYSALFLCPQQNRVMPRALSECTYRLQSIDGKSSAQPIECSSLPQRVCCDGGTLGVLKAGC